MIRLLVLLLPLIVGIASARRSPNADYVEQFVNARQGRYSSDVLEDAKLDVPGLLAKYGYPYEIHNVITSDGYILEAHRIPHGRDNNNQPDPNRPVVFLMHGLLSSSADYLVLGPGNALGYYLAEAGYDVWLGNARGNYYSRRHRTQNPDSILSQSFWRFSWDEIGNYDLPAFIDYILDRTGQEKLHYIGHSQGGTTFLVLNSLRPEYNEKFISFQGLAPASYFPFNKNPVFNALAPFENVIESAAFSMNMAEIFGNREFITWFSSTFCSEGSTFQPLCLTILSDITATDHFNTTLVPLLLGHAPAGASIRQVAHYGQSIRFDTFRRYNHNFLTNLAVYGQRNPPEYDMSKITVPTYLHYGLADTFVDYRDIYLLSEKLGNTIGVFQVERPSFNHLDFVWGGDAKKFYVTLLEYMRHAENL